MTEEETFLDAIRENPEDDTPRLIFADWLEEHKDPLQAEFIRIQIELANWRGRDPNHCPECGHHWVLRVGMEDLSECEYGHRWLPQRYKQLHERQMELFTWKNINQWYLRVYSLRTTYSSYEFNTLCQEKISVSLSRRGFVESVGCSHDEWMGCGAEIVLTQPVTYVDLFDKRPDYVEREAGFSPRYVWNHHPHRSGSSYISLELCQCLPNNWFTTEQEGCDALSVAALRYAAIKGVVDEVEKPGRSLFHFPEFIQ